MWFHDALAVPFFRLNYVWMHQLVWRSTSYCHHCIDHYCPQRSHISSTAALAAAARLVHRWVHVERSNTSACPAVPPFTYLFAISSSFIVAIRFHLSDRYWRICAQTLTVLFWKRDQSIAVRPLLFLNAVFSHSGQNSSMLYVLHCAIAIAFPSVSLCTALELWLRVNGESIYTIW